MNHAIGNLRSIFMLVLSVSASGLFAQDLNTPIPFDQSITTGTLPNGLKYFIKPNAKPEKKVELRLAVKVGSILENDDQQGMAHFIEHMNFNGTEHYPKNELVDYLQSIGVQFGADLNAYTRFDETVYILPIPTTDPANVEKGFEVLSDWAQKALFTDVDINEERNVILEESRGAKGANDRMMRKFLPKLLAGSQYANRLPIGKEEIIRSGSADAMRAFHHDWYRPNLMAVMVTGDITVQQAKALIDKYFVNLTNPVPERPLIEFTIPAYKKTEAMVITDKEATMQHFMMVHSSLKNQPLITLGDYRQRLVMSLFITALNTRLAKRTESADVPYLAANAGISSWVKGSHSFQLEFYTHEDMRKGLNTAIGELLAISNFGFDQTEIDVVKNNFISGMENLYNERKKKESGPIVDELVRHFLYQEIVPGVAFEYKYYLEFLPYITVEEINEMAKQWLDDSRPYYVVAAGPEQSDLSKISEKTLLEWVNAALKQKVTPPVEKKMPTNLLKVMPSAGSIKSQTTDDQLHTKTYTLSNGVMLTVMQTDLQEDQIILYAARKGGKEMFAAKDKVNSNYMIDITSQMGYGDFRPGELDDFLAGKNAGVSLSMDENLSSVYGYCGKKDLETLLQLTHLKMTSPRKDDELFQGIMSVVVEQMRNAKLDPRTAFMDSIYYRYYNNHPLMPIGIPTDAQMAEISAEKVIDIHRAVFGNADGYHFVLVGNFPGDTILPLVNKYLASLPAKPRNYQAEDNGLRPIRGVNQMEFRKGQEQKCLVIEKYYNFGAFEDDFLLHASFLSEVMNIKITEVLREKIGGVYSGAMNTMVSKEPYPQYSATLFLPCGPNKVDTLLKVAHAEISRLKLEGPTAKDLDKVKKAALEKHREALQTNVYWVSVLMGLVLHPDEKDQILNSEERINAVTTEDLQAAANVLFSGENVFRAILYPDGPKDEVKSPKK